MAVVTEVKNTGCALIDRLSIIACFFSIPRPWDTKAVMRICTQSATATVRIMVGAPEVGGEMGMPIQPPAPIAIAAENTVTIMVAIMPKNLRVVTISTTAINKNMVGVSVAKSDCAASENELDSICEPVNSMRILGYLARMVSCNSRALATMDVVATTSSVGGRSEIKTAAVRLSSDNKRLASNGSLKIVSSI